MNAVGHRLRAEPAEHDGMHGPDAGAAGSPSQMSAVRAAQNSVNGGKQRGENKNRHRYKPCRLQVDDLSGLLQHRFVEFLPVVEIVEVHCVLGRTGVVGDAVGAED